MRRCSTVELDGADAQRVDTIEAVPPPKTITMSRIQDTSTAIRAFAMANVVGMASFCLLVAAMLFVFSPSVSAAISSKNHPGLKEILKQNPKADANKDGVLSFTEYQAFLKTQATKKHADGHEVGLMSTLMANGDLLIADFEVGNLDHMKRWGWKVEGEAFQKDLRRTTEIMKRRAATLSGKYLLTSYPGTDAMIGKVVSPRFTIDRKYVQFQLSGGENPRRTCVNLVVDGKVMRTATGKNRDLFETVAFDVTALKGKQANIEIVDSHTGLWGHVNVDRIAQTGQTASRRVINKVPIAGQMIGTVQTIDQHRSGPLMIEEGRLKINTQPLALDNVLLAICSSETSPKKNQSALRLIHGEVWFGTLVGLKDGEVTLNSPMFKQRAVPLTQIASIEFKPGKTTGGKPGTLYRMEGEPIPGTLVWIRDKDVAIDCALGIVPIPRASVQRLVLAPTKPPTDRSKDEVALVDGSMFRGTLISKENQLVLDHDVLGPLNLKWLQIRYIRRADPSVIWLEWLENKVVDRVGPILPPPLPSLVESTDPNFLRAVRMMPRTVTQYELPTAAANRTLRAMLAPVPRSRTDVNVRIKAGNRVLWERKVTAGSEPIRIAVDLQRAKGFVIEVDYGDRLAFPCGVDWRDAHVLVRK
jgi:hypothetical protein